MFPENLNIQILPVRVTADSDGSPGSPHPGRHFPEVGHEEEKIKW